LGSYRKNAEMIAGQAPIGGWGEGWRIFLRRKKKRGNKGLGPKYGQTALDKINP